MPIDNSRIALGKFSCPSAESSAALDFVAAIQITILCEGPPRPVNLDELHATKEHGWRPHDGTRWAS